MHKEAKRAGRGPTFGEIIRRANINRMPLEEAVGGAHLMKGEELAGVARHVLESRRDAEFQEILAGLRTFTMKMDILGLLMDEVVPANRAEVAEMLKMFMAGRNAAIIDSVASELLGRHLDESCAQVLGKCRAKADRRDGRKMDKKFEYLAVLGLYGSFLGGGEREKCGDALITLLEAEKDAAMQFAISYALTLLLYPKAAGPIISLAEKHACTANEVAFYKEALILATKLESLDAIGSHISRFLHGNCSPRVKASAMLMLMPEAGLRHFLDPYLDYVVKSAAEVLGFETSKMGKTLTLGTVLLLSAMARENQEPEKRKALDESGLLNDLDAIAMAGAQVLIDEAETRPGFAQA